IVASTKCLGSVAESLRSGGTVEIIVSPEWREDKEDWGDLSPRNLVGRGSVRATDFAWSRARTEPPPTGLRATKHPKTPLSSRHSCQSQRAEIGSIAPLGRG